MEEVEAEAAPKAAAGPKLGLWRGLRLPIRPPRGQEDHPGVRCELTQSLSLSLSFDSIAFHSLSDLLVWVSQLRK